MFMPSNGCASTY